MPRRKLPARLYLRQREGREPRWVIVDGRTEIDTGCGPGDHQRAQEKLGAHIEATREIDTSSRNPAQVSVADVIALYLKTKPAPPACYHGTPLLGFFGLKTLRDINGQLCRAYAAERGQAVVHATVRRELGTLQAAINHWHVESPLDAVPKVWKPQDSAPRDRVLTRNEAARLLAAARRLRLPYVARFILLGLYTGTRHATILALRWYPSPDAGWLDADAGIIYRAGTAERQTRKRRTAARMPDRLLAHVRRWARLDNALRRDRPVAERQPVQDRAGAERDHPSGREAEGGEESRREGAAQGHEEEAEGKAMTERPILFSAPMVRAILDGRKTQTRRILKPQPPPEATSAGVTATSNGGPTDCWTWISGDPEDCDTWGPLGDFKTRFCPGDLLWVRETVRAEELEDGLDGVRYPADDAFRPIENTPEASSDWVDLFHYRGKRGAVVPPIHMPRWASRITLRVTDVKVERLQEISEQDAMAEGCIHHHDPAGDGQHVVEQFSQLWQGIHGTGSWDANPWVAAITFERLT